MIKFGKYPPGSKGVVGKVYVKYPGKSESYKSGGKSYGDGKTAVDRYREKGKTLREKIEKQIKDGYFGKGRSKDFTKGGGGGSGKGGGSSDGKGGGSGGGK